MRITWQTLWSTNGPSLPALLQPTLPLSEGPFDVLGNRDIVREYNDWTFRFTYQVSLEFAGKLFMICNWQLIPEPRNVWTSMLTSRAPRICPRRSSRESFCSPYTIHMDGMERMHRSRVKAGILKIHWAVDDATLYWQHLHRDREQSRIFIHYSLTYK